MKVTKKRAVFIILVCCLLLCCILQSSLSYAGSEREGVLNKGATIAETSMSPGDLNFRKVWNHRNLFSSEIDFETMDFNEAAESGSNSNITKTAADGLILKNTSPSIQTERIPLGSHLPYGAYDLDINHQSSGSVGLELYKDANNRLLLTNDYTGDNSFTLPISQVDVRNADGLIRYNDIAPANNITSTQNGIKFAGTTTSRAESYVPIGPAKQGGIYETTVIGQSTTYGNAILKLRKDTANGIYLVTNASGVFSYEVFKSGTSVSGSKTIISTNPAKPYTMRAEISGKNMIFSRYLSNGTLQHTTSIDVSQWFDLTDPAVLGEFEAVMGFRGANSDFVEYSRGEMLAKTYGDLNVDFSKATHNVYHDAVDGGSKQSVELSENNLKFSAATYGGAEQLESFTSVGIAAQGLAYKAAVATQSGGTAVLQLRKDSNNGIRLVSNAAGALNYTIYKNGSISSMGVVTNDGAGASYVMQIEISGKNLILSRYMQNGLLQASQSLDVSGWFDLSDPSVIDGFEAVIGLSGSAGSYVEYSNAAMFKPDNGEFTGELRLKVYSEGTLTKNELISDVGLKAPYTLRMDFAAESIGSGTRKCFLSVWEEHNGKAVLLKNNIDIGIDFSSQTTVGQYKSNLYCELQGAGEVSVSKFKSYINGGAAQADPKPLHDETGTILREGDIIWLGMTVRGYDIHSSYQGVYSLNIRTGELKIVSLLAFDLNGRGAYGSFHAADIIYNSMADEWIVMPTAHNESPHAVKSGRIPRDPRTVAFQFVSVSNVDYPNQSNEEDASLIYDYDAGEWRLVMCDSSSGGYQVPLYRADSWDGKYTEIARYSVAPCTGIQLQKINGQYYVFFGRNTDNCEFLRYPQMSDPVKIKIQSSPRSYNVWPVMIPLYDDELGRERLYMLSFDRDTHGGNHSYGNVYLYEADEFLQKPAEEEKPAVQDLEPVQNGEITTAQQLMQIRNGLNGNYTLKNDIDLAEIDNWVPIGDASNPFTGKFDGGGFAIKNLNIDRPNTNYIGLFGCTGSGAEIKNLKIAGADVNGKVYTGALAGYNQGLIENCSSSGSVTAFSAGGVLAGQNTGKILSCSSGGEINTSGGDSFGGLVGVNSANIGAIDASNKGIIRQSFSTATVNGRNNSGGLVGQNDCGVISDCYATGDVIGLAYVGGFAGNCVVNYGNFNSAKIANCYAASKVKGEYAVGGFIGHNDGILLNCFFEGEVDGGSKTGGFAGINNSKASLTSVYMAGSVSGGDANTGGLFGWNRGTYEIATAATDVSNVQLIGNSPMTVLNIQMPDLKHIEVYQSGQLSGFNNTIWILANGQYPTLN